MCALVELGAALEQFIKEGSPVDKATARLDEQYAQQTRSREHIVECIAETLTQHLDEHLHEHVVEADMHKAANAVLDQVWGFYGDE